MKYTNLQMVQIIASSMDSDEVGSVNDTAESLQILNCIRTCYYDMVNQAHLPEDKNLFNLNETSAATPVLMSVPDAFASVEWIKYDIQNPNTTDSHNFKEIRPLSLEDFLNDMYDLNSTEPSVSTFSLPINTSTVPFYFRNDKMPDYYTTIDDTQIVFDSYQSSVEPFLDTAKTIAKGRLIQTYLMTDQFIPPMDEDQFQLLLQMSKSLAWAELKQTPNAYAERSARTQKISQQINKKRVKIYKDFADLPYFGRK